MSTTGIEAVLSRAMSDAAFADALFADAEKSLAGFDLTAEEVAKFKNMSRADFDTLMSSPEQRKSFGIIVDQRSGGGWDLNHNQSTLSGFN